jgi:hypothetical protein
LWIISTPAYGIRRDNSVANFHWKHKESLRYILESVAVIFLVRRGFPCLDDFNVQWLCLCSESLFAIQDISRVKRRKGLIVPVALFAHIIGRSPLSAGAVSSAKIDSAFVLRVHRIGPFHMKKEIDLRWKNQTPGDGRVSAVSKTVQWIQIFYRTT